MLCHIDKGHPDPDKRVRWYSRRSNEFSMIYGPVMNKFMLDSELAEEEKGVVITPDPCPPPTEVSVDRCIIDGEVRWGERPACVVATVAPAQPPHQHTHLARRARPDPPPRRCARMTRRTTAWCLLGTTERSRATSCSARNAAARAQK